MPARQRAAGNSVSSEAQREPSGAHPWRAEIAGQVRLALPVLVIQLGLFLMGAVDGAFLGRVDAVQFAACGIGSSYVFLFLSFGMGFLSMLDPIVSQAVGAADQAGIQRGMQRGLVFALALSGLVALAILPVARVLNAWGIEAEVVRAGSEYALISIWGVPAFLIFVALRQVLQSMHRLRPLIVAIVLTNLLNVLLDWIVIDGHLGFEPMGASGSAWATVISRWCMLLLVPCLAWGDLKPLLSQRAERLFHGAAYLRMARIGLPSGLQWLAEIGAFTLITFMMGGLGTAEVAGHQVAMHLCTLSFMVPVGISISTSVRVGRAIGRGDMAAMRLAAKVGLVAGATVMASFGILFALASGPLVSIFTDLNDVQAVAVVLLPVAALFQVFDGTQVVAVGIMRGMGETRIPMILHTIGFWGIAIPLAYFLTRRTDLGAVGLWWALASGLCAVALAQFTRLRMLLKREIVRVEIDAADPLGELEGSP